MASALETARYFIHLAAAQSEPDFLTPLRLQKLLYYAQGWSLAMRGQPLFKEPLLAGKHGPVERTVYQAFREHRLKPIPPSKAKGPIDLLDDEKRFIRYVWEFYKDFSPNTLREMTHRESPWISARMIPVPGSGRSGVIALKSLEEFFRDRLESELSHKDRDALAQAIQEYQSGKDFPLETMLAEFNV